MVVKQLQVSRLFRLWNWDGRLENPSYPSHWNFPESRGCPNSKFPFAVYHFPYDFPIHSYSGWWFGCHQFYFPIYWVANHPKFGCHFLFSHHILGIIIPIDELIFFRVALAHQWFYGISQPVRGSHMSSLPKVLLPGERLRSVRGPAGGRTGTYEVIHILVYYIYIHIYRHILYISVCICIFYLA